jgi:hypothetical protein
MLRLFSPLDPFEESKLHIKVWDTKSPSRLFLKGPAALVFDGIWEGHSPFPISGLTGYYDIQFEYIDPASSVPVQTWDINEFIAAPFPAAIRISSREFTAGPPRCWFDPKMPSKINLDSLRGL